MTSLDRRKVLFATHNQGKIREAEPFFRALNWKLITPREANIKEFPEEESSSFAGNSLVKALHGASESGLLTVGEDSGLCASALCGGPGVHSRRWMEDHGEDFLKILFNKASNKNDFSAFMISVLSVVSPDGARLRLCRGKVEGRIVKPVGSEGFGYDPVFMPSGFSKTFGEMLGAEKQDLSHRAAAFRKLIHKSRPG